MGLAIGGMVIDQMQRAQARDRDYDDEPRDAPTGRHVDKPRNSTAVSKPKKQDPPSVARKKKDEPVYAKSDTLYAKKQDTPHSGRKKDEPRSGRTDEPVSRRAPPQPDPDRPDPLPQDVELELMLDQITNGGMPVRNADGSTSIITTDPKGQLVRFGPGHKNCYEANEYLKLAERAEADAADKRKQAADLKGRDFQGLKDMLEDHADRRTKDAETFRTKAAQAGACGGAHPIR
jgi:hypothetical protein